MWIVARSRALLTLTTVVLKIRFLFSNCILDGLVLRLGPWAGVEDLELKWELIRCGIGRRTIFIEGAGYASSWPQRNRLFLPQDDAWDGSRLR